MVDRISALAAGYKSGKFGAPGEPGVILQDMRGLVLHQIAVWSETADEVGRAIAGQIGAKSAPGPCRSQTGKSGSMLRIEPLKWWLFGVETAEIDAEKGVLLDLSHSRTHIRVAGNDAVAFLNRHLPLDLRESAFPVDAVASSAIHHVGVTLWRSSDGYELFIPRGFALALWQGFVESAAQFGLEVV